MIRLLLILTILQGLLLSATIKNITINNIEIPVIYEKQEMLPTFNLQLVFQNSGYIQDGKKNGLCSLSASLLNEGTKKLGSVNFAHKLESKAISLHTAHGFETFVIELSSLTEQYNNALQLLEELLNDPNLTKNTLDKIKTKAIGKLKRLENDYDWIAKNNLKKILFHDTPLAHSSSGTIKTIDKINISDIENFLNQTLTLENLIIVVGGDIEYKQFKKDITARLKDLPQGKYRALKTFDANDSKQIDEIIKETQQAYIYFGSPFDIEAKDKDVHLAKVASFILGGSGFGSRMMEEIRVKRGLAYSAYGSISINKSYSYFNGYLQTKLESAKEAQDLVQELVNDFVQKGATQNELDAAKKFLLGSEPLRTETLAQRQSRAFQLYYKGLDLDYPKKELEKISNIKLEELNDFIKEHQEIKQLSFSIVRK